MGMTRWMSPRGRGDNDVSKKRDQYSIIDKGLMFEGTLTCKGEMIVNGTIKGTVDGGFITIGEEGAIYAECKIESMIVGGIFEGTLEAKEKLEIRSTGSCSGKVVCRDLVVESGGILNAQVTRMGPPREPEKLLPPPEPEPYEGGGLFKKKKK